MLVAGTLFLAIVSGFAMSGSEHPGKSAAGAFVQDNQVPQSTELLLLVHRLSTPKAPVQEYRP